jgi:transposase-like protein
MPKKARVFSREMKLAAVRRMMAGESVSVLARELKLRRHLEGRAHCEHAAGPERVWCSRRRLSWQPTI